MPVSSLDENSQLPVMLTPPADVTRAPGEETGPIGVALIPLPGGPTLLDLESQLVALDGRTVLKKTVIEGLAVAQERDHHLRHVTDVPDWLPLGEYSYVLEARAHRTGDLLERKAFAFSVSEREVCDGEDNDGNGLVDEGFDQDADGFLACAVGELLADCGDRDSLVFPGALEVCGDARDNDCDDIVDEGSCSLALRDTAVQ